mmetsp:Transcript_30651/g.78272  ORF Transcript_30651/g.78272 Transcript_30651/m.78272 type:complete len:204 (+) Transcript_30651:46-657(+)
MAHMLDTSLAFCSVVNHGHSRTTPHVNDRQYQQPQASRQATHDPSCMHAEPNALSKKTRNIHLAAAPERGLQLCPQVPQGNTTPSSKQNTLSVRHLHTHIIPIRFLTRLRLTQSSFLFGFWYLAVFLVVFFQQWGGAACARTRAATAARHAPRAAARAPRHLIRKKGKRDASTMIWRGSKALHERARSRPRKPSSTPSNRVPS